MHTVIDAGILIELASKPTYQQLEQGNALMLAALARIAVMPDNMIDTARKVASEAIDKVKGKA